MPLLEYLFILICVGAILFCINRYGTFIDGNIKKIINFVVIICVVLWTLNLFGVFGPLSHFRVGR